MEDKDRATRFGDACESGGQQRERLLVLQALFGVGATVIQVQTVAQRFAQVSPAVRPDQAKRDAEQPRAEWAGRVEGRPIPVKHREDVLKEVIHVQRAGAESLQGPEDIVELTLERPQARCRRTRPRPDGPKEVQCSHPRA